MALKIYIPPYFPFPTNIYIYLCSWWPSELSCFWVPIYYTEMATTMTWVAFCVFVVTTQSSSNEWHFFFFVFSNTKILCHTNMQLVGWSRHVIFICLFIYISTINNTKSVCINGTVLFLTRWCVLVLCTHAGKITYLLTIYFFVFFFYYYYFFKRKGKQKKKSHHIKSTFQFVFIMHFNWTNKKISPLPPFSFKSSYIYI